MLHGIVNGSGALKLLSLDLNVAVAVYSPALVPLLPLYEASMLSGSPLRWMLFFLPSNVNLSAE